MIPATLLALRGAFDELPHFSVGQIASVILFHTGHAHVTQDGLAIAVDAQLCQVFSERPEGDPTDPGGFCRHADFAMSQEGLHGAWLNVAYHRRSLKFTFAPARVGA